jgi:hypothetical protein
MKYAVDLDGCLAHQYWKGWPDCYEPDRIGKPIMPMVRRVRKWLKQGHTVQIFTARVYSGLNPFAVWQFYQAWTLWSSRQFGQVLPVTSEKEPDVDMWYDDRAVGVEHNTGRLK